MPDLNLTRGRPEEWWPNRPLPPPTREVAVYTGSSDLRESLSNHLESPKYHDVVLKCKGQEFKVHRVILCGQSTFFSTMFDGPWKESNDRVVNLDDDDLVIVEMMVRFFYRFDYDDTVHIDGKESPYMVNALVYALADKYDCQSLKELALRKFEDANHSWHLEDLLDIVRAVYDTTPSTDRGLRDQVVDATHYNLDKLIYEPEFMDMLEDVPGFAADLTRAVTENAVEKAEMEAKEIRRQCPGCKAHWTTDMHLLWNTIYNCFSCGHSMEGHYWNETVRGFRKPAKYASWAGRTYLPQLEQWV
ncbi:POZ domain-containing protein [Saccharata proteae CBS 121410]|uniref:POZ domain-containing protein n=1 Tax=Saccharata proteae CBS 121410 TaxID=1314787 RepID=A0A9P4HQU6_9PEZI|nr:POZ domain-containing protein [Saccharata proteae CBS 121410]